MRLEQAAEDGRNTIGTADMDAGHDAPGRRWRCGTESGRCRHEARPRRHDEVCKSAQGIGDSIVMVEWG